jgi:hypothetical protein
LLLAILYIDFLLGINRVNALKKGAENN